MIILSDKSSCKSRKEKAQKFILDYLNKNARADILNADFIDKFIEATGSKYVFQPWGAHTCRYAGVMLSDLYRAGKISRVKIGINNWQPGFPKWVYVYTLEKLASLEPKQEE